MSHPTALDNLKLINAVGMSYAKALYDLTAAQGVGREVADELNDLVDLLDEATGTEVTLGSFLGNLAIPSAKKAASIQRIFEGRVHPLTLNLLLVLNSNDRLNALENVAASYEQVVRDAENYHVVELTSAVELVPAQVDAIKAALIARFGGTVEAFTKVDPAVLGGVKIKMSDMTLDGTLATQLKTIERQLMDKGRELARKQADRFIED